VCADGSNQYGKTGLAVLTTQMNRRLFLERAAATALFSAVARGAAADAADFGFSPDATGIENSKALQRAVDRTGTIVVSRPGTYQIAATVYLGSNTSLLFDNNVFLKKAPEQGPFTHVLLNKGALTRTYDEHITVSGLQLIVNGVDVRNWQVYGLHGQVAFFYAKDVRIERFRCLDGGPLQFIIHVCTFEDLTIDDIRIKGLKDGVHLGRGKRFAIRNGTFDTGDDALALNGHDYAVGNPELGWIEDGVVENMHDLPNPDHQIGYFCRIVAGAWSDWRSGMQVRQSDTVVSGGRLYRVQANPDGTAYQSVTRPTHESGARVVDSINWGVVQNDVTYTAGVRNVVFRDITLQKVRIAFSVHFGNDKYSRSYYPGAAIPRQENLNFDNVRVLHDSHADFLQVRTPVDALTVANCSLRDNGITFESNTDIADYGKTRIGMTGCVFGKSGPLELVVNRIPRKQISLKTAGSVELAEDFSAKVVPGPGTIVVDSDLTGLRK
jgi:polygalacturonase